MPIGYLEQEVKRPLPLSRLNVPPEDLGVAGAQIALKDNNTTGRFTKQQFTLEVERVPPDGDAVAALAKLVESGHHFVLVDAPAKTLLGLADSVKGKDVLLFNVSAPEVSLRQEDCRANVLHTAPDRTMLADALAQYLVWKKWPRWLVVKGTFPEDLDYLAAIERAAKRFGGVIVEEREYKGTLEARRTDSGPAADPAADAELDARRARLRRSCGRRREGGVRALSPVSHLGPAPGRRHRRPQGHELASGA